MNSNPRRLQRADGQMAGDTAGVLSGELVPPGNRMEPWEFDPLRGKYELCRKSENRHLGLG